MTTTQELCARCGLRRDEHPVPPPGPPDPPPSDVHAFVASDLTLTELLAERDTQINHWRGRAYQAEHLLRKIRNDL